VDSPWLSAQLLLARVLGLDRVGLFLQKDTRLNEARLAAFDALVERRAKGEPVAYLLGEKEFYGLDFRVTPDTLIPRPETEQLIELALARFDASAPLRFADFGAGSGALSVTLAARFPRSLGLALDLSLAALRVAAENASRHGVAERLLFARADFGAPPCPDNALDLIVANPPYISDAEYARLSIEVRGFEPRSALTPRVERGQEATGLESIAAALGSGQKLLKPGGVLLLEMGCGQGPAVLDLAQGQGAWSSAEVRRDLAGLDRVAVLTKSSQAS
jgi:release factor glutamine methyltransferase